MTIQEAIGVNNVNVDTRTGEKLTHTEVYGRAIEFLGGLKAVAEYIPYSIEFLRQKVESDPNLNNTVMRAWDIAAGFIPLGSEYRFIGGGIWLLYVKHGITWASCSEGVCILKEAARRLAQEKVAA